VKNPEEVDAGKEREGKLKRTKERAKSEENKQINMCKYTNIFSIPILHKCMDVLLTKKQPIA
jgi:hypothetical protein